MAGKVVAALAGLVIIFVALRDVFQGVIVPRAENTTLRVSRLLMNLMWRVWTAIAFRFFRRERRRENFLATFAPFHLVTLLVVWLVMLLIGWGLFFYALRDALHPANLPFIDVVYYAGASMLTIGYGDVVATTPFTRIMSLIAAASGLSIVAVLTSFLFAIFGSFQRRETFVVTIGARAGVPPSGVGLLAVQSYAHMREDLTAIFREGQIWIAAVMESHLAYPILMMFRSSHDYESWVGTLGALMDAASLVMSTLDPSRLLNADMGGQARVLYNIGRHLTSDFSNYFHYPHIVPPDAIERFHFDAAYDRLQQAGYALLDRETASKQFSHLRAAYAPQLNAMARWLEVPAIQWVP